MVISTSSRGNWGHPQAGLAVMNGAAGTILANTTGQTLLLNGSGALTNNGTFAATSGGTLQVNTPLANFSGTTLTGGSIARHLAPLRLGPPGPGRLAQPQTLTPKALLSRKRQGPGILPFSCAEHVRQLGGESPLILYATGGSKLPIHNAPRLISITWNGSICTMSFSA